jgi:hypothetical protein
MIVTLARAADFYDQLQPSLSTVTSKQPFLLNQTRREELRTSRSALDLQTLLNYDPHLNVCIDRTTEDGEFSTFRNTADFSGPRAKAQGAKTGRQRAKSTGDMGKGRGSSF